MAGWRNYTVRTEPQPEARANRVVSADSSPNGANGINGTVHKSGIALAFARLEIMACPLSCGPRAWGRMVADARKPVQDGWGAKALVLGWSEVDLFGIAKDQDGSLGLAAWLAGDQLSAISDTWAVVCAAESARRYFSRPVLGATLPWDIASAGRVGR